MGARSGGGAGFGSRSGGGQRDYLAEAGISMDDVTKVMNKSLKNVEYNATKETKKFQKKLQKQAADKAAFEFLVGNIEAGLKAKKAGKL